MIASPCCRIGAIGLLLLSGPFLSAPTHGAPPPEEGSLLPVGAISTVDIVLSADGSFQGSCVDANGESLANSPLYLLQQGEVIALVLSDEVGHFTVDQVEGGVYQILFAGNMTLCRVWTPAAAPPSASPELLLVSGPTQRAQLNPSANVLGNPWVIAGVVITGIAVPIAIYNIENDRTSASSP